MIYGMLILDITILYSKCLWSTCKQTLVIGSMVFASLWLTGQGSTSCTVPTMSLFTVTAAG